MDTHLAEEFARAPCKDAALCVDCVGIFEKRAVAADRARIAQAIREELRRWPAGGDAHEALAILRRVVEGG